MRSSDRTTRTRFVPRLCRLEDRATPSTANQVFAVGAAPGSAPVVRVYLANPGGATPAIIDPVAHTFVAPDPGQPPSQQLVATFNAYDASVRGGVRVAVGDVNGDGTPDVITAPGPGGGPHVKVFDGKDLLAGKVTLLTQFFAYDPKFAGGVYVAAGQIDPSTPAREIVTGADAGGGPHVRTFAVAGSNARQISGPLGSFYAYDAHFSGGVRVAAADLNGDGADEIVTGAGPGGGPHVEAFRADGTRVTSFYAYDPKFIGGVFVAAGRVLGGSTEPSAEIVTGAGAGGGSQVRLFDGSGKMVRSLDVGTPGPGGVRVGLAIDGSSGAAPSVLFAGGKSKLNGYFFDLNYDNTGHAQSAASDASVPLPDFANALSGAYFSV